MTRISVIVTAYNVEPYIAMAMQSVIDAAFENLELILVDDGSTDATRQVAEIIATGAPHVDFVPLYFDANTPGGVGSAANAGLDRATGEVVIFVDGDDWVIPAALRQAVQRLIESDADFVVCGCREYWNDSGAYAYYPEQAAWQQATRATTIEARRRHLLKLAPFPWRKVYRRAFLEQRGIRFPVGDFFFEDNPFHWETSVLARQFIFFEPVTHVHRMARSGQTVMAMGRRPLQIFQHAVTIRRMLERTGMAGPLAESYWRWLLDHILWCARHVDPPSLNLLYDCGREAIVDIPAPQYYDTIANMPLDRPQVRLLTALQVGDRMSFIQAA